MWSLIISEMKLQQYFAVSQAAFRPNFLKACAVQTSLRMRINYESVKQFLAQHAYFAYDTRHTFRTITYIWREQGPFIFCIVFFLLLYPLSYFSLRMWSSPWTLFQSLLVTFFQSLFSIVFLIFLFPCTFVRNIYNVNICLLITAVCN